MYMVNYHFLWRTWRKGKVWGSRGEGRVLQYRRMGDPGQFKVGEWIRIRGGLG